MVLYKLRNQNIIQTTLCNWFIAAFYSLLPTVAIMRFSQSAYSQCPSITPLSVSLVLDAASGTTTQAIVEQITAIVLKQETLLQVRKSSLIGLQSLAIQFKGSTICKRFTSLVVIVESPPSKQVSFLQSLWMLKCITVGFVRSSRQYWLYCSCAAPCLLTVEL